MSASSVTKDIYAVGILNPAMRIFDVVMKTEYGNSYNSYLVKGSEKTALIETCHLTFFDQYLDNIRQMQERQELLYQEAEDEAKRNADAIVAEADAYSRKAHADADAYWEEVRARVDSLRREQESLRSLIQSSGPAGTV